MKKYRAVGILVVTLVTCSRPGLSEPQSVKDDAPQNAQSGATRVNGAGSTFINPLLQAWIDEYVRLHPGPRIEYRAVGSLAGIRLLTARSTFFAVTEYPMTDDQQTKATDQVLHFPVALDATVPVYNLPHLPALRFSGSTLASIFLGKITRWNDPAIASDNPGANLPQINIKVVHHFPYFAEGGHLMADFLSKVSPEFKATLASSRENWPVANGMAGCRGGGGCSVPGVVRKDLGAMGCVELEDARQNQLDYGGVKNSDGEFVTASAESITSAADADVSLIRTQAPDFRFSISNALGKGSYPISGFVWLLMFQHPKEKKEDEVIIDFLRWVLTDGQKLALKLGYAALPSDLVQMELQRLGPNAR